MDYSLNKRKMAIGARKGSMMYVASPVCQKQRVSFDKLCEIMAEDSTIGQADIAAVYFVSNPNQIDKVINTVKNSKIDWEQTDSV